MLEKQSESNTETKHTEGADMKTGTSTVPTRTVCTETVRPFLRRLPATVSQCAHRTWVMTKQILSSPSNYSMNNSHLPMLLHLGLCKF